MIRTSPNYLIVIFLLCSMFFISCADEEEVNGDLVVENTSIKVKVEAATYMKILSGGGGYGCTSSNRGIVIASIEDNQIKISGISAGNATVTITDKKGQKVVVYVEVDFMNLKGKVFIES